MKNVTLVIMAAGIGSRFGGGIKQLTSFGPSGEIIMDYSVSDAVKAGFNKIVFVIRKDLEKDFKEIIGNRIAEQVEVAYAFQELRDIPGGYEFPEERKKPWGTGQAILACRDIVREPFAVINADDYYGKDAFVKVHDYLASDDHFLKDGKQNICMAGFVLKNTLSDFGGVTRGVCKVSPSRELEGIQETKNIIRTADGAAEKKADGTLIPLDPSCLVSMNFWGFQPEFIDVLKDGFSTFFDELGDDNALTAEYLLPVIVDRLLKQNKAEISVLQSNDQWFGVTYQEDVPAVKAAFERLIADGVYPEKLWD